MNKETDGDSKEDIKKKESNLNEEPLKKKWLESEEPQDKDSEEEGESQEESQNLYAEDLAKKVRSSFPTPRIAKMIEKDEEDLFREVVESRTEEWSEEGGPQDKETQEEEESLKKDIKEEEKPLEKDTKEEEKILDKEPLEPQDSPQEEKKDIEIKETPPPPPGTPGLMAVHGYGAEELKKEIEGNQLPEEAPESPEDILIQIKEERKYLEEERALLKRDKERKEQKEKIEKEKKTEDEEYKPAQHPKEIKSFAKERRKRKELEHIMDYLIIGEYVLLVILVMAILYADGISTNPLFLPIENSIYLIIIFILIIKVERLFFRYLNMKYSGTLQRKVIGVDHFTAIEIPSMMLLVFIVAVFIIPPTRGIIDILIKMFSFEGRGPNGGDIIPFSDGFTLHLTLLFITSLGISVTWLLYLRWYKVNVLGPEIEKVAEPFEVDEVFLITNSGLLLRHLGKDKSVDMDDDILSSMLTAVSEFVKDSFAANKEEGELDELQYGSLRVILEYGKHVYLAAVVRGQESKNLRPEMIRALRYIQRKFGHILENWNGALADIKGIESPLKYLIKLK